MRFLVIFLDHLISNIIDIYLILTSLEIFNVSGNLLGDKNVAVILENINS